jgi:hypothetical protein
MDYIDMIETLLVDNGIDVEDYTDELKGISQYEAIENALVTLIKKVSNN